MIKALNRLGLLKPLNLEAGIKVNGKSLRIPVLGGLGLQYLHLSEPWMTNLLLKLRSLKPDNFVDIGVNLGQTLVKAYSVFDGINYVGFEPNCSCVNYAREIVRRNSLKNFNIIPVGISNHTEVLKLNFFSKDDNDSSASILEDFRPDQQIVNSLFVPVFDEGKLIPFLPETGATIVKIDVEGAELEVLQGFSSWVSRLKPIILIEILPAYSIENKYRVERQLKLQDLLGEWGYSIFRIKKDPGITLDKIDEIGIHSSIEQSDYILCHKDSAELLKKSFT